MTGDVWGPIDVASWRNLPACTAKLATEEDVENGRAVFFVPVGTEYEPSSVYPIELPFPAILIESNKPVIAIQCEEVNGKVAVGFRYVAGGNGLCLLDELEVLRDVDARFGS